MKIFVINLLENNFWWLAVASEEINIKNIIIKYFVFEFRRSRIVASACASIINYVLAFTAKKTYYDLETTLSLPGTSLLYSVITGVGLVWLYFILPDTENRTLEEIEAHFTDDSKKITDRKIYDKTENSQTQHLLGKGHKFSYEAI